MLAVVVAALPVAEEGLRSEAGKEEHEDVPRNLSKKTSPMTRHRARQHQMPAVEL